MRRGQLVLVAFVMVACHASAAPQTARWDFRVTLDGQPIGSHRFAVITDGAQREVESSARYEVKWLGLTVYRYAHRTEERWSDDCLTLIDAHTDDDGNRTEVQGRAGAVGFEWWVRTGAGTAMPARSACPMSFAYWNPAIERRSALLDPASGRLESVSLQALPPSKIDVHGSPTAVRGLRILGLKHPIDVWYRGNDWVGLDTTVAGGRSLRYRLP